MKEINVDGLTVRRYITMHNRLCASKAARGKVSAPIKRNHYRTTLLLKWLCSMGWTPIASQVPVSSSSRKVATLVDLVCLDTCGNYVLTEVKTGFAGYHDKGSGARLLPPFHEHTDCPDNQHMLQVLATRLLFLHTFDIPPERVRSIVLRVEDKRVVPTRMAIWVDDTLSKLAAVHGRVVDGGILAAVHGRGESKSS